MTERGYSYWPGGPASKEGFWGPTTSTLDWCEENYVITHYIAEFWNTFSNLFFIAFALYGIETLKAIGAAEVRHFMAFGSLIIVAIGSMCFHGTMWYNAQMADELPMIYNGCIICFCLLQTFPEAKSKRFILGLLFTCYSAAVTGIYLTYKNPQFLALAHGVLTFSMVLFTPFQISRLQKRSPQFASNIVGLWDLYKYAVSSYLAGIGSWTIDNQFCDLLRDMRAKLGTPLGFLFELHVFWHLATAMGGYACILVMVYMRLLALGRKDMCLEWMHGVFPVLVLSSPKTQ
ncbi:UNVERIFIED_CONTAM: Alkaline ceramidase 3 [Siphonaria sp. JEL0065]|nr:Alkaline ceramidase 3 [Siphonaria sp. JEL0065]